MKTIIVVRTTKISEGIFLEHPVLTKVYKSMEELYSAPANHILLFTLRKLVRAFFWNTLY